MPRLLVLALASLAAASCAAAPAAPAAPQFAVELSYPAPTLTFEPYTFAAFNGTKVEAERGFFEVPENRNDPASRKIRIGFVRFPATTPNPGPPIVYLAGGPGASGVGTAQGARFPIFMALREQGDVIALDQRGIGLSRSLVPCLPSSDIAAPTTLTRDATIAYYRDGLKHCFDRWTSNGADIDGYTTLQNAHDIEDLRRALGAPKLNLWGISYGSHLGLTFMKYHPGSVSRAVLAGIEGLDETVKLPSETDAYFARVQAVIDADPRAKAIYPDLAAMMRRVHARLDETPASIAITPAGASTPVTVTFDGFAIQLLASSMIADPGSAARLPDFYLTLDRGDYTRAASMLHGQFLARPQLFNGMPEAMDLASGVSPARMTRLEAEFRTALLGDALNFPMPHVAGIRPELDLGDDFRAPFASTIPTLFISGTLDGRTYPAEAAATVAGFSHGARLIVENGGHNIYEADTRIGEAVAAWFRGESVPAAIRFEPPPILVR